MVSSQPPPESLDVVVRSLDERLSSLVVGHGLLWGAVEQRERGEEIERREFKVGLLSEAKKFLAIAVDAGRKGDLSTAKLNRYLCEEYLKMAKDS